MSKSESVKPEKGKYEIVVIDGPAGVGKDTLAEELARALGFEPVDSGKYFRAVAARALETGEPPMFAALNLTEEDFGRDLRSRMVESLTAEYSQLPEVRKVVNKTILASIDAKKQKGIVMAGRAGAYEFPEAKVKIYLTASAETRAHRRVKQLIEKGKKDEADFELVLADIMNRDKKDMERAVARLRQHPDAMPIDSEDKNPMEVKELAVMYCSHRLQVLAA